MNTMQLTTLSLEISALLLLILYLALFVREKFRNVGKRGLFAMDPNDARILHKSCLDEMLNLRLRELGIAVLTALLLGFAFCISYLDVLRTNYVTALIFLLSASAFIYYAGAFMILSVMYRLRESRIMLHKFVYRQKKASGKIVSISLLRQSLYYMDKKAFNRKKNADFTMIPDLSTILILIPLTAFQVFNIVYFIDLLAPL